MRPIYGAREHDSVYLHVQESDIRDDLPDPPATEVVNSAITLFATALPLQSSKVQEGVLEQLATFLSSNSLQRDPGRKAAVTANTGMAILGALKVALGETFAEPGDLKHPVVEKCLQEMLHVRFSNHLILEQELLKSRSGFDTRPRSIYSEYRL